MAAPPGVKANRWNQAVNAVTRNTAMTSAEADAWLNAVWVGMFNGDEIAGDGPTRDRLRLFLETAWPDAPTLPTAFRRWALS